MSEKKSVDLKILWQLFSIFFKAGTFTFAGGLAMLPVLQEDVVNKSKLMEREEFLEYATLSQTLPGVIALNCASFVGKRVAGFTGMVVAGIGATISAFVLMILAIVLLTFIPEGGPVAGAFSGIKAASAGFVLSAAFTLGKHNVKNLFAVVLMVASFLLVFVIKVSAPLVVLGAAAAGILWQWFTLAKKERNP